jgi:hypothetical protein
MIHSNVPGFLLVANVKQNKLFYSWPEARAGNLHGGTGKVVVPVTEIDINSKKQLRKRLVI